jgi:hypothetical protein
MSSSGDGWIKPEEKTCVEGKKNTWRWMGKKKPGKSHVLRGKKTSRVLVFSFAGFRSFQ